MAKKVKQSDIVEKKGSKKQQEKEATPITVTKDKDGNYYVWDISDPSKPKPLIWPGKPNFKEPSEE